MIAERTGCPVVSDFRVRDVAAGGEGAPLVPLVDHLLFRAPGRKRALQNIGGIANVTLVGDRIADIVAFDNGPGNMPLDAVARAASGGLEAFDRDGLRGARGAVDGALLTELHRHPYLALPLPKTTGREDFGKDFVYPLLSRYEGRLDDLLATLTRFTAETIARSYREVLPALPDEVFVSGGGALNPTLMRHLVELLAPIPVQSTGRAGRRSRGQRSHRLRRPGQPDPVRVARQRASGHRRQCAARAGKKSRFDLSRDPEGSLRLPATALDEQSSSSLTRLSLEVPPGFEPGNEGFADPCLTTWPRHRRPRAPSS